MDESGVVQKTLPGWSTSEVHKNLHWDIETKEEHWPVPFAIQGIVYLEAGAHRHTHLDVPLEVHPLLNVVYWGYNPLITFDMILTSWHIQAQSDEKGGKTNKNPRTAYTLDFFCWVPKGYPPEI